MDPQAPCKENTCAAVVTYNPDAGFADRARQVCRQVAQAVIVDNGSTAGPPDVGGAHVIANSDNLGIAAALNQGLAWARAKGYAWALTLDQDSCPRDEMVEHLCHAYAICPYRREVAIVAANFFDPIARQCFYPTYGTDKLWLEVITAISSGSLVSLAALAKAGPLREDFFIDSVDNEYCLRLRKLGYRIIVSARADMTHVLGGQRSVYRRHSVRISASDYGPRRRYYMTRNRLVLAAEYAESQPGWVVRELTRAMLEIPAMLLLERWRLSKLAAMGLGVWHAAIGKMGKADSRLWRQRP